MVATAAEWAAELDAGTVSDARRRACEAWCAQDPRHRLALDRMIALDPGIARLDGAGRNALRKVLRRRGANVRRMAGAALGVLAVGFTFWFVQGQTAKSPAASYAAANAVREVTLADGSRLQLDAGSAANFQVDRNHRRLVLQRGQVMAHVAPDRKKPFVVETPLATATALGTAYLVRDEGVATLVAVTESKVEVCTRQASRACLVLHAGEGARVSADRLVRLSSAEVGGLTSWTQGWLEADDRPAAEVLADLNRYRTRPVAFEPGALAGLRVTGAYPLDGDDRAVESLAQATGLRLSRSPDGALRLSR